MTTLSWSDVAFEEWLASLHDQSATPATRAVLSVLMHQPEKASQASTQVIADTAGVNVASVTRAAQALGFEGWPNLRDELRTRLLASAERTGGTPESSTVRNVSLGESFDLDMRITSRTVESIDRDVIAQAIERYANASTRLVIGGGTYAHAAHLWAVIAGLAGYPSIAPAEGFSLGNSIAQLGPSDIVVALGFWRLHESTIVATEGARSRGATVCVVTDQAPSPLTDAADLVIRLSAEGSSFFPSLAPTVLLINAFCAELAALDPARTKDSLRMAEVEWNRSHLLRRPGAGSS